MQTSGDNFFGERHTTQSYELESAHISSLITSHWRNYNATPPEERLGDEDFWDAVLRDTVVDAGVAPEEAQNICAIAKLEAQFED